MFEKIDKAQVSKQSPTLGKGSEKNLEKFGLLLYHLAALIGDLQSSAPTLCTSLPT